MEPSRKLQLPEILEFRPEDGTIRLHEQRVVILSAAALGLLRKELITTLGADSARRLLLRFGYADGYHDAVSLRDRLRWRDPLEGFRAGASLHTLEGIVHAEIVVPSTTRRAAASTRRSRGAIPTKRSSTSITMAGAAVPCAGHSSAM
jgi:hypothetical protein